MSRRQRCSQLTLKGEPCTRWAMAGVDRCASHLGLGGRKTTLTEDVTKNLVTMLRAGNYLNVALKAANVAPQTYRDWLKRGKSTKLADALYRDFRERVEVARAEGEVRLVTVIARAAQEGDWRAGLALLEREFPERWGPVSVRVREVAPPPAVPEPVVIDADDPFAEVDELAERRRRSG